MIIIFPFLIILYFKIRYLNLLVRAGCDASEPDLKHKRTPLMFACIAKNEPLVHFFIEVS